MRHITTIGLIICLCAGVLWAQEEIAEETAGPIIDPADLEAFLDGVIEGRMESFDVAGVTVSVVHDGEMIFAKGYGYANVENRVPVDPAVSLFRPGSISKTFTWTAVMQLVEQGKLDLNEDIRTYLVEVEIPDTFSEPITMLDLMAHAPGFEDSALGHLFGNDPGNVSTLKDYLAEYQPARVRPPGEVSAYSNYGSGLAGLVVANISGMPFEDYVDQEILGPLGMNSSTFREPWKNLDLAPMPAQLEANSSVGYTRKNGGYEAGDFEFIHQVGPAGALSTTATDMARYMLMHLGLGTLDGVQILEPETSQFMQQRHFGNDDAVNGMAHGFIEERVNGYRGIGHSGGTLYFLSQMVMIPELDFGLFASSNTAPGGARMVFDLPSLVAARYFPPGTESAVLTPPEDFTERAERFEGTYTSNRRNYTMLEKLPLIFMSTVKVAATDDGYLVVESPGSAQRFVEAAPLTFHEVDGDGIMKFVENSKGKITGFVTDQVVHRMDRTTGFDVSTTIEVVAAAALLVCLGVVIAAWYRRKQKIDQSGGERLASFVLVVTALTWLVCFAVSGFAATGMMGDDNAVMFDFPSSMMVRALVITLIGVIETVVCVVLLYPVWSRKRWGLGRRLRHTFVVAVMVVLVLVLYNLNMIGFKYF
jgi:CubicO group peptidase (beta-lactamase class C family)